MWGVLKAMRIEGLQECECDEDSEDGEGCADDEVGELSVSISLRNSSLQRSLSGFFGWRGSCWS